MPLMSPDTLSWEERMHLRAAERGEAPVSGVGTMLNIRQAARLFAPHVRPSDLYNPNGLVLAARMLGITIGDPGPLLPEGTCRTCWGDRSSWGGMGWVMRHTRRGAHGCNHPCHEEDDFAQFIAGAMADFAMDVPVIAPAQYPLAPPPAIPPFTGLALVGRMSRRRKDNH